MATSLRQWVKIRATDGRVWFLRPLEGDPVTNVLTLYTPAGMEELLYPAILDYVTLLDSNEVPWHMRVNASGTLETVQGNTGGLNMAGYGVFGLELRGATQNIFSYTVGTTGTITVTNTAAPSNDIIDPDYVDGASSVAFCRHHNLAYRPDERIYRRAATHCPVDGARLRGWRDTVRGAGESSADLAYDEERW